MRELGKTLVALANGNRVLAVDDGGEKPVLSIRARARQLAAMADDMFALAADLDEETNAEPEAQDSRMAVLAREAYRNRRLRRHFYDDEALFGEPAWDLLLDLFIAAREGKQVPVTSACIGAAVPTTTALRWLAVLEARGMIVREADGRDARRIFVRLSAQAEEQMTGYFTRLAKVSRTELQTLHPHGANGPGRTAPFMLGK